MVFGSAFIKANRLTFGIVLILLQFCTMANVLKIMVIVDVLASELCYKQCDIN